MQIQVRLSVSSAAAIPEHPKAERAEGCLMPIVSVCSKGASWAFEAFSLSGLVWVRYVLQGSLAGVDGASVGACGAVGGARPPAARSGKQGSRMLIVTGRLCLVAEVCPGGGSS